MVELLLADAAAVDPAATQLITVGAVVALIAALAKFLTPIWTALGSRISHPGQPGTSPAFDQAAVDRATEAARAATKIEDSLDGLAKQVSALVAEVQQLRASVADVGQLRADATRTSADLSTLRTQHDALARDVHSELPLIRRDIEEFGGQAAVQIQPRRRRPK